MDGQVNNLSLYECMSFISCVECIRVSNFIILRFKSAGSWCIVGCVIPSISNDIGSCMFRVFILLGLHNCENACTTVVWNTVNWLSIDTGISQRLQFLVLPLRDPPISHWIAYFWSHGCICPCFAWSFGGSGTTFKLYGYNVIYPSLVNIVILCKKSNKQEEYINHVA